MVILAVDLGKARTGIAVCDKLEMIASPVTVINQRNREKLLTEIAKICGERKPEQLVVGLPKNMDNSEGESALNAREFASQLSELTGLPVDMQDERGTTITAHNFLNVTDTRGQKRKAVVDAVAAVIILEDYMRKRKLAKEP